MPDSARTISIRKYPLGHEAGDKTGLNRKDAKMQSFKTSEPPFFSPAFASSRLRDSTKFRCAFENVWFGIHRGALPDEI